MIDVRFRSTPTWPRKPTASRRLLPGQQTYNQILDRLETEMTHLKARDIVIETGHNAADIRMDGWVRSNARQPAHPGVIVSFESQARRGGKPIGPLSYACDTYSDWKDNLRAIVLTLESLRAVDRYGATTSGEQYRGWALLPAPDPNAESFAADDPARFLLILTSHPALDQNIRAVWNNADVRASLIRAALKKAHPDAGGSDELFQAVQAARQKLEGGQP